MKNQDDKQRDLSALESVESCAALFREASARVDTIIENGPQSKLGKACRDWYQMAVLTLRVYSGPGNWPDGLDGEPRESIPLTMAHVIANQLEYVSIGRIPGMMQWAQKRGYEPGPHEKRDIGYAVAYIKAARAGEIADGSPIKSVAAAYGATTRTVKRWQATYGFAEPSQFFPGVSSGERAALLAQAMPQHGARYRISGRTPEAIKTRARKRKRG